MSFNFVPRADARSYANELVQLCVLSHVGVCVV